MDRSRPPDARRARHVVCHAERLDCQLAPIQRPSRRSSSSSIIPRRLRLARCTDPLAAVLKPGILLQRHRQISGTRKQASLCTEGRSAGGGSNGAFVFEEKAAKSYEDSRPENDLGKGKVWNTDEPRPSSEDEISFLFSCNYCVYFVDIIGSTRITAAIGDPNRTRQYYSMFFSKISPIARRFNARIIKIAGDCLICYFPKTADPTNNFAFKDVLECGRAMIAAHDGINFELNVMNLPPLGYRISADYGRVEIAKSATSLTEDLFGSTMNLCAKINRMAAQNGMVIGGDLYQIIKSFSFNDYAFEDVGGYDIGLKHFYPVYSVMAKNGGSSTSSNSSGVPIATSRQSSSGSDILRRLHLAKDDPQETILGGATRSANVMVVDDEPDMLLTFKEFLRFEGHRAEVFANPQEALKRYREANISYYDLIILDIRMPGMNGLQLYQRLKAINSNINVLFISALDAADELCSVFSGILPHNVIRKPVIREQFVHKVESCLAGRGRC